MRSILMYHSIDPSGSPISVSAEQFRRHVRWLASGRVRVLDVAGLLADRDEGDAVALTFDDALASFGDIAWPLLRDAGLPVSLFVPTAHVGGSNAWNPAALGIPSLPLMGWEALARAAEEGVELAAHTRSHPSLPRLSRGALEDEILGGTEQLQRETGRRAAGFAYPFGEWSPAVLEVVRLRFQWACTTELRPLGRVSDPCLLPRIDAYYLREAG
ncbi:MAG TPA: polysaccharide deacetylase family protein, partial [Longimicrobiales bacterium]